MYSAALVVHSWLRWIVLALAVAASVRSLAGHFGRRPWTAGDERLSLFLTIALDLQLLVGLSLYLFLSPFTTLAFNDFGAAMRDREMRFWAVEHLTLMLAAIVLVHVGRVVARRVDPARRHTRHAIFVVLATLAMLAATPWPGTANARPLFRVS